MCGGNCCLEIDQCSIPGNSLQQVASNYFSNIHVLGNLLPATVACKQLLPSVCWPSKDILKALCVPTEMTESGIVIHLDI